MQPEAKCGGQAFSRASSAAKLNATFENQLGLVAESLRRHFYPCARRACAFLRNALAFLWWCVRKKRSVREKKKKMQSRHAMPSWLFYLLTGATVFLCVIAFYYFCTQIPDIATYKRIKSDYIYQRQN